MADTPELLTDKVKWGLAVDTEVIKGHTLKLFLPVQMCSPACPAFAQCIHVKRGRCLAIINYLALCLANYTDPKSGIGDQLTPFEMDAVTLRLMPLYHQLATFQLQQFNMTLANSFYETDKGGFSTHPVFKEIRAVIGEINKMEKELGLEAKWRSKFDKMAKRNPSMAEAVRGTGKSLHEMQSER